MESIKMTASDASEEEMRFLNLLRSLTTAQRNGVIKDVENITQQNAQVIKELRNVDLIISERKSTF